MNCKKIAVRAAFMSIMLLCLLTLSGCWDNAEINGRAFVLGFGADKGQTDGAYDFTFQLAIPVSGDSNSSGAIEYTSCTVTERSVASAIRMLEKNIGRQINFEQLNTIIIGETLSHEKFTDLTELFFRRASVRRQSSIAVCGGSAKEFFASTATGSSIASDAAIALQSYDDRGGADSVTMNLHSLFKVLSNTDEFYLLKISAVNPDTMQDSSYNRAESDTSPAPEGGRLLSISGAVAYGRSGEYRGEITEHELELLRLIAGNQISGIITAEDGQSGKNIYYQIKQSHCSTKCSIQNGSPQFTINLDLRCIAADVGDIYGGESKKSIQLAEQSIRQSLTAQLEQLAEKSRRSLGSSVLGLQDTLRQNMPDWYEQSADRWEEIYANSDITINVKCTVTGGGITK